jgi:hypothetical protein
LLLISILLCCSFSQANRRWIYRVLARWVDTAFAQFRTNQETLLCILGPTEQAASFLGSENTVRATQRLLH